MFDYQSDRHCAKTVCIVRQLSSQFDYQSDRHCAKTGVQNAILNLCLITSQIDTAPKQLVRDGHDEVGLITSQIDTAPKHSFPR